MLVGLVIWIGCDLFVRGASGFYSGYLLDPPSDLGRAGGIGPILFSTAVIIVWATALAVVISLCTAILYTELLNTPRVKRWLYVVLDIGVGVPRIIWGLVGGMLFGVIFGFGFSILTGVITLACVLSPMLSKGFIIGLEAVDPALREQCAALGLSKWTLFWRQVLPAARPALSASMALGMGRGFGDTAALLFTAGLVTELPSSIFDSASTLAVFIFHLLTAVPGGQNAAYAAAAILFLITLSLQVFIACTHRKEFLAQ